MLQQEALSAFDEAGSLARLEEAPRPRQVARPCHGSRPGPVARVRLVAEVVGNVVIGSALLAGLLAAPAVLGRLLGLI